MKGGPTASCTVVPGPSPGTLQMVMEYPKDSIPISFPADPQLPTGEWSVIRFKGKVPFQGAQFDGDTTDPLTFLMIQSAGFVYVHGKGRVTLKDGSTVVLPDSSATVPPARAPQTLGGASGPESPGLESQGAVPRKYKGFEIKVLAIGRRSFWELPGFGMGMKAGDGNEFLIVQLEVTFSGPEKVFAAQRAELVLIDANGERYVSELDRLFLSRAETTSDAPVVTTAEIPFRVPSGRQFRTFEIGGISLGLQGVPEKVKVRNELGGTTTPT